MAFNETQRKVYSILLSLKGQKLGMLPESYTKESKSNGVD